MVAPVITPAEKAFLGAHLDVAWLRPESALWDAIASAIVSRCPIASPSLDLGCGNGIFSFITAGGRFSIDYDWYMNVDPEGFWEGKDIYDVSGTVNAAAFITERPRYTFTVGMDHKANLLKQAGSLSFYERLVVHDADETLPFEDGTFMTVFSNILYWLKDLGASLRELRRVLDARGTALLCLPNRRFYEYCSTYGWEKRGSELLRLLNRGRSASMHWTISFDDFVAQAREAGLRVIDHAYYLSPLTLKVWDIGLRPLSPMLIKMANALDTDTRRAIKKEWVETLSTFLLPLYQMEKGSLEEGGFHFFVVAR